MLDKISILEIKSEKIKDPEKLKFINDEYKILKYQLETNIKNNSEIESLYNSLKEINSKLWVIEDDKRLCEKNSDFGEKFIKFSFSGSLIFTVLISKIEILSNNSPTDTSTKILFI